VAIYVDAQGFQFEHTSGQAEMQLQTKNSGEIDVEFEPIEDRLHRMGSRYRFLVTRAGADH
jgi:hypothetical protein